VPWRLGWVVVAGIFTVLLPAVAACVISAGAFLAGLVVMPTYIWLAHRMVAET